jgi:hypothetical protein
MLPHRARSVVSNVGAMTTNVAKANDAHVTALAYTTLLLSRESNFDIGDEKPSNYRASPASTF